MQTLMRAEQQSLARQATVRRAPPEARSRRRLRRRMAPEERPRRGRGATVFAVKPDPTFGWFRGRSGRVKAGAGAPPLSAAAALTRPLRREAGLGSDRRSGMLGRLPARRGLRRAGERGPAPRAIAAWPVGVRAEDGRETTFDQRVSVVRCGRKTSLATAAAPRATVDPSQSYPRSNLSSIAPKITNAGSASR
jgi:hypothetical protein